MSMKVWLVFLLVMVQMGCLFAIENRRLEFANGLRQRGMYSQAVLEYEALIVERIKPVYREEVLFHLADCYEHLRRTQEAEKVYLQLIRESTGQRNLGARLQLASFYLRYKQCEKACPMLEVLVKNKDCTGSLGDAARFYLGQCYALMGRTEDAIECYTELKKRDGTYASLAHLALADLLVTVGKIKEALCMYRVCIAQEHQSPQKQDAIRLKAFQAAYAAKEYSEANAFADTLEMNVLKTQNLLLPAAWTALYAKRPEVANERLMAALLENRNHSVESLSLQGAIAEALGNEDVAITAYDRILTMFPKTKECGTAAEALLVLRAKRGEPNPFLKEYARVCKYLSQKTRQKLEPIRLAFAVQVRDIKLARESVAWLRESGTDEAAAKACYQLGWLEQQENDWCTAGDIWWQAVMTWPKVSIAPQIAYAAAYAFAQAKLPERMKIALDIVLMSKDESVVAKALLLKAKYKLAQNEVKSAAEVLDEYLARFHKGVELAEVAYLRGLIFFNERNFKQAEMLLAQAVSMGNGESVQLPFDTRVDAMLRRVQALYALGRKKEASALLEPLLTTKSLATLSISYLRWLAEYRFEEHAWGEVEAASRALLEHPKAKPVDRVLAYIFLGRSAEEQKRNTTALAAYEAALQVSTEPTVYDAEAFLGVGRLYALQGANDKARKAFETAAEKANTDNSQGRSIRAQAYAGLAEVCQSLGDNEAALRANMCLIIFFDDTELVPKAFRWVIKYLNQAGRGAEAQGLRAEFKQRYPMISTENN